MASHRRSLLDEMQEEAEQSHRIYGDDDDDGDDDNIGFGGGESFEEEIFMGRDDEEDDEEDSSYSSDPLLRHQNSSSSSLRRGSSHINISEEEEEEDATKRLVPLYEEEQDMGYEDPDEVQGLASSFNKDSLKGNSSRTSFTGQSTHRRPHIISSLDGSERSASSSGEFVKSPLDIYGNRSASAGDDRGGLLLAQKQHGGYSSRRLNFGGAAPRDDSVSTAATNIGESTSHHSHSNSSGVGSTLLKTLRQRTTFLNRFSTTARTDSSRLDGTTPASMVDAVHRLNSHQSGDFEHVAAAAAVVAASAQPSTKRVIQFGRGDHVLVMLTLLGMADQDSENKGSYTIDPVNKLGYPHGKGKTEAQKQGPFLYVLCQVTQVHFDEDERYYTVRRCDTGKEQRADPGYMEPIRDEAALEVALRAAERTERAHEAKLLHGEEDDGPKSLWQRGSDACSMFWMRAVLQRVVPFYTKSRHSAKTVVAHMMHGDHGFAINFRCSSINLLVLCSLIFLFLDVVTLTFFSAEWDRPAAIVGIVVWSILTIELMFEFLIRPSNYYALVMSDKAFAPTTARHINRFHLVCESLALILYIPEVSCVLSKTCSYDYMMVQSPLWAILSLNGWKAALGRFLLGLTFLRAFGLVRHWKQMWINHTFDCGKEQSSLIRRLLLVEERKKPLRRMMMMRRRKKKLDEENESTVGEDDDAKDMSMQHKTGCDEDQQLKSAATIGTALMLVNSHRALFLLLLIVCAVPTLYAIYRNPGARNDALLLQANNLASNTTEDCDYLYNAVEAWFKSSTVVRPNFNSGDDDEELIFVQWAQLLPVRCDWQRDDGVITSCSSTEISPSNGNAACDYWSTIPRMSYEATVVYLENMLDLKRGGLTEVEFEEIGPADFNDGNTAAVFLVRALFDESHTIASTYFAVFLLVCGMVVLALIGLTVMRSDAERLVLFPLQRMLTIVVRYAENPLSTPNRQVGRKGSGDGANDDSVEQLGNYETEQLINAIAKIADLLRKCWGVAGAGIISSNLARTKDGKTVVFNPTIPGKQVYALFGFIGINDFSKQLRALEGDVMILINDVARVVHDEVYRWALGDSGQCNKNLGSAFLMVFRIGDFSEVHDRKKRATDVVFNSQMRNAKVKQRQASNKRRNSSRHFDLGSGGTLQLASLPGIQAFADRALLGCLKSFAGLHRDQNLQNWQKDFRLGAGVGNFTINAIYGFDAGWAVEGAVGSEYKIDATYLSPHVNMASRMMSACKQYGVKVLLSQAVEELLSKAARSKLRHLDTVYVKGSAVDQRIYTYDARHDGVDFFLFERSPEQADIEAESYSPSIWETDQDLKSMRQHVTDEFQQKYHEGLQEYLEGNWKAAIKLLREADNMMFEEVFEQGYVDYMSEDLREYGRATTKTSKDELIRLKNEFGDGACKCLIQYMERRNGVPPPNWHGVRHLMSK